MSNSGKDTIYGRSCLDRKSTRLNSSHRQISYAVFCLKKKNNARDEPFRPHLVDLVLEVLHVLVDVMREATLALQVLVHRLALLAALRRLPRCACEVAD